MTDSFEDSEYSSYRAESYRFSITELTKDLLLRAQGSLGAVLDKAPAISTIVLVGMEIIEHHYQDTHFDALWSNIILQSVAMKALSPDSAETPINYIVAGLSSATIQKMKTKLLEQYPTLDVSDIVIMHALIFLLFYYEEETICSIQKRKEDFERNTIRLHMQPETLVRYEKLLFYDRPGGIQKTLTANKDGLFKVGLVLLARHLNDIDINTHAQETSVDIEETVHKPGRSYKARHQKPTRKLTIHLTSEDMSCYLLLKETLGITDDNIMFELLVGVLVQYEDERIVEVNTLMKII